MARPATPRRPAGRRAARLDRSADRHVPADPESPAAPGASSTTAGTNLPAAPGYPSDQETIAELTPAAAACWALLPPIERERLGLRLSQLVLKAVRPPIPTAQEDC